MITHIKFESLIQKGIGLGKKIGFPTINLNPDSVKGLEYGVYACDTSLGDGVMHFGPKSVGSENDQDIHLEIHLLNLDNKVESRTVSVKVLKKIRDVREFKSKDELINQIKQDIQNAKSAS